KREEEKKRQKVLAEAMSDNAKPKVKGDLTTIVDGRSTTRFNKEVPADIVNNPNNVRGGDIFLETPEEKARRAGLTPQQKLEEDKEAAYKRGDYSMMNEAEVTARLKAEGKNVVEGKTESIKSDVDEMAEVGAAVPVFLANTISKAVKIITGQDMGQITTEEFASTEVGKALGLVTLGAEGLALAATAGYFAATLIPSSAAGLSAAGAAKAATAGAAVKSGLMAKVASAGLTKVILGGGAVTYTLSLMNGRISDLESSVDSLRETATLINSAVAAGAISKGEAILMFNDLEGELYNSEKAIQETSIVSPKAWVGKGYEAQVKIEKAKIQIATQRQILATL
ncbi:MAG: hypothetical protein WC479_11595, partial [Candidatus Izemoplasmatales bacterium]